jgi:hypothetical protein
MRHHRPRAEVSSVVLVPVMVAEELTDAAAREWLAE